MIPPDVSEWIFPKLATENEDLPKIELPCGGIALKFIVARDEGEGEDDELTWDEFRSWKISLDELAEIAGINGFSYNVWETVAEDIYENQDKCWSSFVLAPSSILEHNYVSGRHVVYVIDENSAILTGDRCQAGLERIRSRMKTGLAHAPMVINSDWRTWSRFDLPSQSV